LQSVLGRFIQKAVFMWVTYWIHGQWLLIHVRYNTWVLCSL